MPPPKGVSTARRLRCERPQPNAGAATDTLRAPRHPPRWGLWLLGGPPPRIGSVVCGAIFKAQSDPQHNSIPAVPVSDSSTTPRLHGPPPSASDEDIIKARRAASLKYRPRRPGARRKGERGRGGGHDRWPKSPTERWNSRAFATQTPQSLIHLPQRVLYKIDFHIFQNTLNNVLFSPLFFSPHLSETPVSIPLVSPPSRLSMGFRKSDPRFNNLIWVRTIAEEPSDPAQIMRISDPHGDLSLSLSLCCRGRGGTRTRRRGSRRRSSRRRRRISTPGPATPVQAGRPDCFACQRGCVRTYKME